MKLTQLLSVSLIAFAIACTTQNKLVVNKQEIVGNWLLKGKGPGYPIDNTLITNLIINPDNTYQFVHAGYYNRTVSGTYTLIGNELKFQAGPGYTETYQIISLDDKKMEVTVRKQNIRTSSAIEQVLYEKVAE